MNLKLQKQLVAKAFGVGKKRVKLDPSTAEDIKDAITRADVRSLVEEGTIKVTPKSGTARHRARERKAKQKKGRMSGQGRRKGRASARTIPKTTWINKVRLQRKVLSSFKNSGRLTTSDHRTLYLKSKGGFFRSKKHMLQYIEQNNLLGAKTKK